MAESTVAVPGLTTNTAPCVSVDQIKSANWSGSIPVVISLAATSLSSPTIPPPIHVLLSRHTFLHVGLRSAVLRLHKYAPPTISFPTKMHVVEEPEPGEGAASQGGDSDDDKGRSTNAEGDSSNNDDEPQQQRSVDKENLNSPSSSPPIRSYNNDNEEKYPICWFEDEATEMPLRWQLFAGILFDQCSATTMAASTAVSNDFVKADASSFIPWKIRLHFTSYPSNQLLELGSTDAGSSSSVWTTVQRTFKNSLKQALFLQHGNSKVAMNMTKQSHQQLWDSIISSKYSLYRQVHAEQNLNISVTNNNGLPQLLPIRVLVNSQPPIQKKCVAAVEVDDKPSDEEAETQQEQQQGDQDQNEAGDSSRTITKSVATSLTLGQLLCHWVPQFFEEVVVEDQGKEQEARKEGEADKHDGETENENDTGDFGDGGPSERKNESPHVVVKPNCRVSWHVSGIVPPLSTLIFDLWKTLSHPDHFLYIVVTTTSDVGT